MGSLLHAPSIATVELVSPRVKPETSADADRLQPALTDKDNHADRQNRLQMGPDSKNPHCLQERLGIDQCGVVSELHGPPHSPFRTEIQPATPCGETHSKATVGVHSSMSPSGIAILASPSPGTASAFNGEPAIANKQHAWNGTLEDGGITEKGADVDQWKAAEADGEAAAGGSAVQIFGLQKWFRCAAWWQVWRRRQRSYAVQGLWLSMQQGMRTICIKPASICIHTYPYIHIYICISICLYRDCCTCCRI